MVNIKDPKLFLIYNYSDKNKIMKKYFFLIAIFALAVFAGIECSRAFTLTDIKVTPNADKLDKMGNVAKKWQDARCAKFKEKLGNKIDNINEKNEQHRNTYDNLVSRFETLIARLENKGYDTQQLKTDLETLEEKIEKFKADFKTLSERVKSTQEKVCEDTDSKIKTNLGETRSLVQKVRRDAQEIRNYYRNEIRSDIKDLKNQTPDSDNDDESKN
jgi:chromosome segregation ATPase